MHIAVEIGGHRVHLTIALAQLAWGVAATVIGLIALGVGAWCIARRPPPDA